jgi:hypothetical protein
VSNRSLEEFLLRTKLYIPPLRSNLVPRPRLIEQLNQGSQLGPYSCRIIRSSTVASCSCRVMDLACADSEERRWSTN